MKEIRTITWDDVESIIKDLAKATIAGDKYEIAETLLTVEEDTGYDYDFIYDIFVEQIEDEYEDNMSIEDAIYTAAKNAITPAYEQDY